MCTHLHHAHSCQLHQGGLPPRRDSRGWHASTTQASSSQKPAASMGAKSCNVRWAQKARPLNQTLPSLYCKLPTRNSLSASAWWPHLPQGGNARPAANRRHATNAECHGPKTMQRVQQIAERSISTVTLWTLARLKASPASHIAMQAFMAATASNKSNLMAETFKRLCCTSNRGIQKEKLMDRHYQDNAFSQAPE